MYNFTNTHDIAKAIQVNESLNLASSMLIAVPIPVEYAMDSSLIDAAITNALESAQRHGIEGKLVTPYLLSAIAKITDGSSLTSSMKIILIFFNYLKLCANFY